METQTTKYFTKLIKINVSNIQQTQYPLKLLLINFYITFYEKQLTFIKYTANLIPVQLKLACIFVFLQEDIAYPCFF